MKEYKSLYLGGEGEIVEKKSRFIATIRPVTKEEDAVAFFAEMKKKYWDARHNCTAFVIGDNNELQRCSDDGEPSGTAGRPMLDVLLGQQIHNIAVVVTRYFGGTLLGTGGLVRAYSGAVQEGLAHCTVIVKKQGYRLPIQTDYNGIGKIQYILGKSNIYIENSEYTDVVRIDALVPAEELTAVQDEITEGTNGRAKFLEKEAVLYAMTDEGPLLFD